MLFALYLALVRSPGDLLAKAAFVVHVGLFIVWQPLVERGVEVSPSAAAGLFGLAGVLAFLLDGWVLSLWLILLAAIVGGRVMLTGGRRERFGYLLGLSFLVVSLLTLAVPAAIPAATLPPIVRYFAELVLPFMLVAIALLPVRAPGHGRLEVVDFVNSVLILLLLSVLVLGSLAGMVLFAANYAEALLKTLMLLGGALLLLGWLWNPHLGYSGLETFVSRYLMSIGISAEQWLEALADLAVHESDPERFVAEACRDLQQRLPWIRGVGWALSDVRATLGDQVGHTAAFSHQGVTLTV